MPIKPDRKYDGTIGPGAYFAYSTKGSLGFFIPLECEDGNTTFTLWLTEKNREKAMKTLEMLGADTAKLGNQNYIEMEMPNLISGKEISFGTKDEEYNGKTSTKVSWIGKRTDKDVAHGAAEFFGVKQDPIGDNDIPF